MSCLCSTRSHLIRHILTGKTRKVKSPLLIHAIRELRAWRFEIKLITPMKWCFVTPCSRVVDFSHFDPTHFSISERDVMIFDPERRAAWLELNSFQRPQKHSFQKGRKKEKLKRPWELVWLWDQRDVPSQAKKWSTQTRLKLYAFPKTGPEFRTNNCQLVALLKFRASSDLRRLCSQKLRCEKSPDELPCMRQKPGPRMTDLSLGLVRYPFSCASPRW